MKSTRPVEETSTPPDRKEGLRAIAKAERLLPGTPRKGSDPRWQAILMLEDFIPSHPEELWEFVLRWGKHMQADLRSAIACCLLEHLLADQFSLIFPRACDAARKSRRFRDTLGRCNWIGQAARPRYAVELDRLVGKKRPRIRRAKIRKKWTEKELLKGITPTLCGPDLIPSRAGRELD